MLENTLSALLVSVAGQYAHVSAPELGVGLSGGRLVLENVRLRANAFNSPRLPCAILGGTAGRIRVDVPWSALSSAPVSIYLENVHLIAGPKKQTNIEYGTKLMRHGRKKHRHPVVGHAQHSDAEERSLHDHSQSQSKRGHQRSRTRRREGDHSHERDSDLRQSRHFSGSTPPEYSFIREPNASHLESPRTVYDKTTLSDPEDYDSANEFVTSASDTDTSSSSSGTQPSETIQSRGTVRDRWHETLLGRLGFNVAVELYGLKIEYRDRDCISIMSLASCKACSADVEWKPAFVPLDGGGVAVAMRKYITLSGLHWVMLPRNSNNDSTNVPPEGRAVDKDSEILTSSENDTAVYHRQIDANAYESRYTILDGISVALKLLLCNSEGAQDGFHIDLDIELEEPVVNLSARQLSWIHAILNYGSPRDKPIVRNMSSSSRHSPVIRHRRADAMDKPTTKRLRGRSFRPTQSTSDPILGSSKDGNITENVEVGHRRRGKRRLPNTLSRSDVETMRRNKFPIANADTTRDANDGGGSSEFISDESMDSLSVDDDSVSEDHSTVGRYSRKSKSAVATKGNSFTGLWQIIVGDNVEENVDDASVALGFRQSMETFLPRMAESDHTEFQYARQAVASAVASGGFTFRIRLVTPDIASRTKLNDLQQELMAEKMARARLEDSEHLIREADIRVEEAKSEIESLKSRNTALMGELADLEKLTGAASASKDVMIRQLEAALAKAEHMLQAMAQEKLAAGGYTRRKDRGRLDLQSADLNEETSNSTVAQTRAARSGKLKHMHSMTVRANSDMATSEAQRLRGSEGAAKFADKEYVQSRSEPNRSRRNRGSSGHTEGVSAENWSYQREKSFEYCSEKEDGDRALAEVYAYDGLTLV